MYRLGYGLRFSAETQTFLYLWHRVQSGSGTHTASTVQGHFIGVKWPGSKAGKSYLPGADVKNLWSYTSILSPSLRDVLKHEGNLVTKASEKTWFCSTPNHPLPILTTCFPNIPFNIIARSCPQSCVATSRLESRSAGHLVRLGHEMRTVICGESSLKVAT